MSLYARPVTTWEAILFDGTNLNEVISIIQSFNQQIYRNLADEYYETYCIGYLDDTTGYFINLQYLTYNTPWLLYSRNAPQEQQLFTVPYNQNGTGPRGFEEL